MAAARPWQHTALAHIDNDRWEGAFTVEQAGMYEFLIEAWGDRFATWVDAFAKKFEVNDEELP